MGSPRKCDGDISQRCLFLHSHRRSHRLWLVHMRSLAKALNGGCCSAARELNWKRRQLPLVPSSLRNERRRWMKSWWHELEEKGLDCECRRTCLANTHRCDALGNLGSAQMD